MPQIDPSAIASQILSNDYNEAKRLIAQRRAETLEQLEREEALLEASATKREKIRDLDKASTWEQAANEKLLKAFQEVRIAMAYIASMNEVIAQSSVAEYLPNGLRLSDQLIGILSQLDKANLNQIENLKASDLSLPSLPPIIENSPPTLVEAKIEPPQFSEEELAFLKQRRTSQAA